jgi:hypothetical protein
MVRRLAARGKLEREVVCANLFGLQWSSMLLALMSCARELPVHKHLAPSAECYKMKGCLAKSMPIERISIAMISCSVPASTMYPLSLVHQTADHLINRLLGQVNASLIASCQVSD